MFDIYMVFVIDHIFNKTNSNGRERSGSVEERLTQDRGAGSCSLTGVTALCS